MKLINKNKQIDEIKEEIAKIQNALLSACDPSMSQAAVYNIIHQAGLNLRDLYHKVDKVNEATKSKATIEELHNIFLKLAEWYNNVPEHNKHYAQLVLDSHNFSDKEREQLYSTAENNGRINVVEDLIEKNVELTQTKKNSRFILRESSNSYVNDFRKKVVAISVAAVITVASFVGGGILIGRAIERSEALKNDPSISENDPVNPQNPSSFKLSDSTKSTIIEILLQDTSKKEEDLSKLSDIELTVEFVNYTRDIIDKMVKEKEESQKQYDELTNEKEKLQKQFDDLTNQVLQLDAASRAYIIDEISFLFVGIDKDTITDAELVNLYVDFQKMMNNNDKKEEIIDKNEEIEREAPDEEKIDNFDSEFDFEPGDLK